MPDVVASGKAMKDVVLDALREARLVFPFLKTYKIFDEEGELGFYRPDVVGAVNVIMWGSAGAGKNKELTVSFVGSGFSVSSSRGLFDLAAYWVGKRLDAYGNTRVEASTPEPKLKAEFVVLQRMLEQKGYYRLKG